MEMEGFRSWQRKKQRPVPPGRFGPAGASAEEKKTVGATTAKKSSSTKKNSADAAAAVAAVLPELPPLPEEPGRTAGWRPESGAAGRDQIPETGDQKGGGSSDQIHPEKNGQAGGIRPQ